MLTSFDSLKQLLAYAKPWQSKIYLATLYSVINKLFDIAPEILIGIAVDIVVRREMSWVGQLGFTSITSQLVFLTIATILIWVFESLSQYLHQVAWRNIAQEVELSLIHI